MQAYLPLDEEQQRQFERLLASESYKGAQAMNVTPYEKGLEKGQRELLHEQLEEQFGSLSPTVVERLEKLPAEQLRKLGKAILRAQSLRELGLED